MDEILSACNDPAMIAILAIVKRILSLIQIIGPILATIMLAVNFIRLMKDPDDKKGLPRVKNTLLALALLFFVPVFVNAAFGLLGESTTFSSCWNQTYSFSKSSRYISVDEEKKSQIIVNPSDYQSGEKNSSTGGGTGDRDGTGNHSAQRVVFIGDSRTVQMYAYLSGSWSGANYSKGGVHVVGNDIYVAEGGMGLNWMKNTGIPAAQKYFDSNTAIVILMGVNDLGNLNKYIEYVNANAPSWKSNGSSLYYVSVNPCNGKYSHMNSSIQKFNAQVKSGLSSEVGWIDTYSELNRVGFTATDGLHYNKATTHDHQWQKNAVLTFFFWYNFLRWSVNYGKSKKRQIFIR